MGGTVKVKKGMKGEAYKYVTRTYAMKKLQLNPADFRRLCILKGVYPQEPKNRVKAQRGKHGIKLLYLRKDIRFLMHEPIIWKFRDRKIKRRRLLHAERKDDRDKRRSVRQFEIDPNLDHIILERYPTFIDAVRDLDDPLTTCFLFAKLCKSLRRKQTLVHMSNMLTVEFMHYVIAARCLKKVFISVKGYYYQADIMGQTVTWIVPHPLALLKPRGVNLKIMRTFLEFYIVLLGFVNYRLYQSLNLQYPPRIIQEAGDGKSSTEIGDLISTLNRPLVKTKEIQEDEVQIDEHLMQEDDTDETILEVKRERDMDARQSKLFEGLKFFLGRETNLESLTFVIKACGGMVSWDKTFNCGSTYQEDDQIITHQIVDRPNITRKHLSRYYVQPQWVYDSINARTLLPVQDYFPGASLPAHVSPFDTGEDRYIPPEKQRLNALRSGKPIQDASNFVRSAEEEELDRFDDVQSDDEDPLEQYQDYDESDYYKELDDDYEEDEDDEKGNDDGEKKEDEDEEFEIPERVNERRVRNMAVQRGSLFKKETTKEEDQLAELNLRKLRFKTKEKRFYEKLKRKEKQADAARERLAYSRILMEKEIAQKEATTREGKEKHFINELIGEDIKQKKEMLAKRKKERMASKAKLKKMDRKQIKAEERKKKQKS